MTRTFPIGGRLPSPPRALVGQGRRAPEAAVAPSGALASAAGAGP